MSAEIKRTPAPLTICKTLPAPECLEPRQIPAHLTRSRVAPMPAFHPPPDYPRIRTVKSFAELVAAPFAAGVNALCWPRALPGGFGKIVTQLGDGEGVVPLDEARLSTLALTAAGRTARDFLLADLALLRAQGLAPELNCIHGYARDDAEATVPTDVHSFHVDSAPIEAATWLCTYHGPASEGCRNEDARRRVDDPATRAALLREYGEIEAAFLAARHRGPDDASFGEFLREHHYDLHYTLLPDARPFSFGLGHLWRIAVDWPGSAVPPCIHRAPPTAPGEPPRLLLIS